MMHDEHAVALAPPRSFTIDLNEAPRERWRPVTSAMKDKSGLLSIALVRAKEEELGTGVRALQCPHGNALWPRSSYKIETPDLTLAVPIPPSVSLSSASLSSLPFSSLHSCGSHPCGSHL